MISRLEFAGIMSEPQSRRMGNHRAVESKLFNLLRWSTPINILEETLKNLSDMSREYAPIQPPPPSSHRVLSSSSGKRYEQTQHLNARVRFPSCSRDIMPQWITVFRKWQFFFSRRVQPRAIINSKYSWFMTNPAYRARALWERTRIKPEKRLQVGWGVGPFLKS